MKKWISFIGLFFVVQSYATQIPFKDLKELVSDADHIFVGKVTKVDMIDGKGKAVVDGKAHTGPGSENQLRLHVKVNKTLVSSEKTPSKTVIPLWQQWHDTLNNRKKEVEGKTFIFLLKGKKFEPVYHGLFIRKLSDKEKIKAILKNIQDKTAQ